VKEIPLSRGMVALVDDEDYDAVMAVGKWYADRSCRTFYARKNFQRGGKWTFVKMHTLITGWDYVDHINGNGLDNRRANLRHATDALNSRNRRIRSDNTSGYKGVHLSRGKWRAVLTRDGRVVFHGSFDSAEDAAHAYDAAAREHFGEFAFLNFPEAVA